MMNDWTRSKYVEQTKNCGIKIDYKNRASGWSMAHRTFEVWNCKLKCFVGKQQHNIFLQVQKIKRGNRVGIFADGLKGT